MNTRKDRKLIQRNEKINRFIEKYKENILNFDITLKKKILTSKAFEIHKDVCQTKLYSSVDVILVYCNSSIDANKKTNCLTEIMFEEAIIRAKFLDEFLVKYNKPFGPLHGVPFSIKDTFDIEAFGTFFEIVI